MNCAGVLDVVVVVVGWKIGSGRSVPIGSNSLDPRYAGAFMEDVMIEGRRLPSMGGASLVGTSGSRLDIIPVLIAGQALPLGGGTPEAPLVTEERYREISDAHVSE